MAYIVVGNNRGPRGLKGESGTGAEDALKFKNAVPAGALTTWTGLANDGLYRIPSQTVANAIVDRPYGAGPGQITIKPVGSTTSTVVWEELGDLGRTWERTISSVPANASGWMLRPQAKRVGTALTCAQGGGVTTATDVGHALPYTTAVRAPRWRIHFRNYNDRSGSAYQGALTIMGISIGEMDRPSTGLATGAFIAGTGKNIVGNNGTQTPATGSEYVTPWVEDYPLEVEKDYVVRYGYTSAAQNNHLAQGGGWSLTAGSVAVNTPNPTMTQVQESPLDVWIEVEVAGNAPVFAYFGDSLTAGQAATLPVYDSWAAKHARANGAIPVFYAHSGTAMTEWTSDLAWKYNKYTTGLYKITRPDRLFWAMGSNDVFSTGVTLADMISRFRTVYPLITAKTTKNVVLVTILPRHSATAVQESVRQQWNAWLKDNLPAGALMVVDAAEAIAEPSGRQLDKRWSASAIDIHLNSAGYARFAAAVDGAILDTGQRYVVDQTAGRTIRVWDYVNGREQLISGDTGVRSVGLMPGFAGTVHVTRVGRGVDIFVYDMVVPEGTADFLDVPAGFRSRYRVGPYDRGFIFTAPAKGEPVIRRIGFFGDRIRIYGALAGEVLSGHFSYFTDDPWPASLPGTAVGTIPYN